MHRPREVEATMASVPKFSNRCTGSNRDNHSNQCDRMRIAATVFVVTKFQALRYIGLQTGLRKCMERAGHKSDSIIKS